MGNGVSHPTSGGSASASVAPHSRMQNDLGGTTNVATSAGSTTFVRAGSGNIQGEAPSLINGERVTDEPRVFDIALLLSEGRHESVNLPVIRSDGNGSTTAAIGAQLPAVASHIRLNRPEPLTNRVTTYVLAGPSISSSIPISPVIRAKSTSPVVIDNAPSALALATSVSAAPPCLNPAADINARLDTQVEIKVYPCSNSSHSGNSGRKKVTQFMVKPEGVIIQGSSRPPANDIGTEYSRHIGRKLPRYELSDTRASQLLITSHNKSFYVIPAPEAFSRHSGTCRLLGDRKHSPANHVLKVGDFLRVGSVGVVVIETHNGEHNEVMSEERIQRIMQETTVGGYVDAEETDVEEGSDVEIPGVFIARNENSPLGAVPVVGKEYDVPTCYMCFDDDDSENNPLISPCKCKGDTQFVHVDCLRKWHTAETDNQICFLSTVDATCSVCKSTFKSDFRLKNGRLVKLFQSSLEPPYVSFLIATKHEMAQRLFNTRFQLSFKALLRADGKNATRSLLLGRSSGSDMVLDYRTVSARHATIKFKNGEFVFADAGSSNGSYLYVRQPVELCANAPSVQFRLGRSMISVKVVNKWNRRLLRAVTRSRVGQNNMSSLLFGTYGHDNPNVNDGVYNAGEKKTRGSIMKSMPPLGMLDQQSPLHLDLIFALAIPKREASKPLHSSVVAEIQEEKVEECIEFERSAQHLEEAEVESGTVCDAGQEQGIIDVEEEISIAQDVSALSLDDINVDSENRSDQEEQNETSHNIIQSEEQPETEANNIGEVPIIESFLLTAMSECSRDDFQSDHSAA